MTNLNAGTLKSKHHFETLDGMRGVAALSVVLFHFMEIVYSDFSKNFIAHGFLAVDFFFCLSGFVMAYAYDDRLDKIGLQGFFKSRLIRLHPLVIFGSVLGLIAFLFDPFGAFPEGYSAGRIALIFLASMFLIPYPVMEERFFNLFGLNAPSWSLFWEYIANIVYALVLVRLNRRVLTVLWLVAAVTLAYVGYRSESLVGGWAGSNFWDGGARIAYSFLAGILVFRFNLILKSGLGFLGMTILLLLAFIMPFSWGWIGQLFVVLAYFPMLISLGAGAVTGNLMKKVCTFSADISYPLYMTHYAVMWMFFKFFSEKKPGMPETTTVILGGLIILPALAYLVMKYYDVPLRKYLRSKFGK